MKKFLVRRLPASWKNRMGELIRKGQPLNSARLKEKTEEEMEKLIRLTGSLFLAFLFLLSLLLLSPGKKETDERKIERPEKGGALRVPLLLSEGEEENLIWLEVEPQEYTEKEFREAAQRESSLLPERIKGKNRSLEEVETDLSLPLQGKETDLFIRWHSSDPERVSSSGRVHRKDLTEPGEVVLTAELSDGKREIKEDFTLMVLPEERTPADLAGEALQNREEASRTEPVFTLPEEIEGFRVEKREKNKSSKGALALLLFFTLVILPPVFLILRIRRAGEERQEEMREGYFRFVNRISLYLGAGLSVTESLRRIALTCREESLRQEVQFTLNRIRSGWSEPEALTEMGKNTGIAAYRKVLAMISQNLYQGSDQLLRLLADQEEEATEIKKERTRKKGEEASEKLLLPTGLLLLTVMVIVVYPALAGM